jgi:hypothetical protein
VPSRTIALLFLTGLTLTTLACNLSGSPASPTEMTLAQALEVAPQDRRPEILRLMGVPDAITITWQDLEGQSVRLEEWSYFDAQTRFDFVDGELVWTIDIDPVPDGSLFAHLYHPLDFDSSLTVDDLKAMLADQTLVEESLAEADVPGGVALIGDQILLGFDGGQLTFVQTFVLSPDGQTAALPAEATDGSPTTEPASAASAPALLADDFEGSSPAQPLFGADVMTYEQQGGEGLVTSFLPNGVVPVIYDQPLLSDFSLEIDVRLPQAQAGSLAGVIFRSEHSAEGLTAYYHFVFQPIGEQVQLDLWEDGRWSTLASAAIPDGVLVPGANDRLRLEARETELRMFVNQTLLLEVDDGALTAPGVVGLSLVAARSPETVYFDNLRIEALDE